MYSNEVKEPQPADNSSKMERVGKGSMEDKTVKEGQGVAAVIDKTVKEGQGVAAVIDKTVKGGQGVALAAVMSVNQAEEVTKSDVKSLPEAIFQNNGKKPWKKNKVAKDEKSKPNFMKDLIVLTIDSENQPLLNHLVTSPRREGSRSFVGQAAHAMPDTGPANKEDKDHVSATFPPVFTGAMRGIVPPVVQFTKSSPQINRGSMVPMRPMQFGVPQPQIYISQQFVQIGSTTSTSNLIVALTQPRVTNRTIDTITSRSSDTRPTSTTDTVQHTTKHAYPEETLEVMPVRNTSLVNNAGLYTWLMVYFKDESQDVACPCDLSLACFKRFSHYDTPCSMSYEVLPY